MNKEQAINAFWNSFGIPAFDENTVPEKIIVDGILVDLKPPYITYNVVVDTINNVVYGSATIWDKSRSWEFVTNKAHEIADGLNGHFLKYDNGAILLYNGSPKYRRIATGDDNTRGIAINIGYEFLER